MLRTAVCWFAVVILIGTSCAAEEVTSQPDADVVLEVHVTGAEWPAWAVQYGQEVWHGTPSDADDSNGVIAVSEVVDRVRHSIVVEERLGTVLSDYYSVELGGSGIAFQTVSNLGDWGFRLKTDRVQVGGKDATLRTSGAQEWLLAGNTMQRMHDTELGVVEHYEARQEGLEVTWLLLTRPKPGQDLRVEVAIDGALLRAEADTSFSVLDLSNRVRARIRPAVLVDARGTRWAVAGTRTDAGLAYSVGAEILQEASFPIALDPTVGPEFSLGNAAAVEQLSPVVGASSDTYLVAWSDARNGSADIIAARVEAGTGTILDPAGIEVSTAGLAQTSPAVACNGTDFLLVWEDARNGTTDVFGARVAASTGTVLDASGISIASGAGNQIEPSVASNGQGFLVGWTETQAGSLLDIMASRIDGAGAVLDPTGIDVSDAIGTQQRSSVASDGVNYFIAWQDFREALDFDIYGTLVDGATGVVEATFGRRISEAEGDQIEVSVASNGNAYMLAWEDHRDGATSDIYGGVVNQFGSLIVVPGFPLNVNANGFPIATAVEDQKSPEIAAFNSNYLLVWLDDRNGNDDVFGGRVNGANASALDGQGFMISADGVNEAEPSLASTTDQALVAFRRSGSVRARLIDASCGDGVLDANEECDDGNMIQTDACPNSCEFAVCGDGFIEAGVEDCDGNGAGVGGESDTCNQGCSISICGDGIVNATANEECDDGNADDSDACRDTCVEAVCGDGAVELAREECDDGNTSNEDECLSFCVAAFCGDTYILTDIEDCDDGNQESGDACSSTCSRDSDNDSISDADEVDDLDLSTPATNSDDDADPDFLDTDSDNDTLSDAEEAGDTDLDTPPVDSDDDGTPDFRDRNSDGDDLEDGDDNCPTVSNPDQSNLDEDRFGDACDIDIDGDGVLNDADNCPNDRNARQGDEDADGIGDACDTEDESGGCGCAFSSSRGSDTGGLALCLLALLGFRRRRYLGDARRGRLS